MLRPLSIACVLTLPFAARAQGFQNQYGASRYEEAVAVLPTQAGLTVPLRHYREGAGHLLRLLRTSLTGGSPTFADIPQSGAVFPQAAVPAADGGLFICGSIIPTGRSDQDAWMVKLDPFGTVLWDWTSDAPGTAEELLDLTVLQDGRVLACGTRRAADADGLLLGLSATGSLEWSQTFGGELDQRLNALAVDGLGIVSVGSTSTFSGDRDVYLLRTDATGTEQWWQTWGGAANDDGRAVIRRSDGTFQWAGWTDGIPGGISNADGEQQRQVYSMALTAAGDTLWTRVYGDTLTGHAAFALTEAANGDVLLAGERGSVGRSDGLVLRTTAQGALVWTRTYGVLREDRLQAIVPMPDGGFVAAGRGFGVLGGQAVLLRKNASGQ